MNVDSDLARHVVERDVGQAENEPAGSEPPSVVAMMWAAMVISTLDGEHSHHIGTSRSRIGGT